MSEAESPGPGTSRRETLRLGLGAACALSLAPLLGLPRRAPAQSAEKGLLGPRLSPWFHALAGGAIRCELCPRRCRIAKGERGFCRVRENRDGRCHTLVFGNPCTIQLDPIEGKPFFHVLPGSRSLSVSTAGCNLRCKFCQTWEMSQASPEDVFAYTVPPELVVRKAQEMKAGSVAYTFGEPVVFHEYVTAIAPLAREAGLRSLVHSSGYINAEPLEDLCQFVDAANIDLKGFSQAFYLDVCGGELAPVLATLKALRRANIHLEITYLVIPTLNDDSELMKKMCQWICVELGAGTPIHLSRFYPLYKLANLPPTPVSTLEELRAVALTAGLEHVYLGKVPGHEAECTYCPGCKQRLIERTGYMVGEVRLEDGRCGHCQRPIPGIWT